MKIKLKPGAAPRVQEWADTLAHHREEVYQALAEEGVEIEAAFFDRCGSDEYLIYFMKVDNLKTSQQIAASSQRFIDAYHKQFKKECWESVEELKPLIYFEENAL